METTSADRIAMGRMNISYLDTMHRGEPASHHGILVLVEAQVHQQRESAV
jgi:hypothetical protein